MEKTKKAIFIDGEHDYDYVTYEKKDKIYHKLYRSKHSKWVFPGELILKVKDDGNGFKFDFKLGKYLEYDVALELSILLKIISFNVEGKIEWSDMDEKLDEPFKNIIEGIEEIQQLMKDSFEI